VGADADLEPLWLWEADAIPSDACNAWVAELSRESSESEETEEGVLGWGALACAAAANEEAVAAATEEAAAAADEEGDELGAWAPGGRMVLMMT